MLKCKVQIQVAEKFGITQQTYAGRERRTKAFNPEYISELPSMLNISVEYLLEHQHGKLQKGGQAGKALRIFDEVSRLPRHKQQRVFFNIGASSKISSFPKRFKNRVSILRS